MMTLTATAPPRPPSTSTINNTSPASPPSSDDVFAAHLAAATATPEPATPRPDDESRSADHTAQTGPAQPTESHSPKSTTAGSDSPETDVEIGEENLTSPAQPVVAQPASPELPVEADISTLPSETIQDTPEPTTASDGTPNTPEALTDLHNAATNAPALADEAPVAPATPTAHTTPVADDAASPATQPSTEQPSQPQPLPSATPEASDSAATAAVSPPSSPQPPNVASTSGDSTSATSAITHAPTAQTTQAAAATVRTEPQPQSQSASQPVAPPVVETIGNIAYEPDVLPTQKAATVVTAQGRVAQVAGFVSETLAKDRAGNIRLEIVLDPAELGRVTLDIVRRADGVVDLAFSTARNDVARLIQSQLDGLAADLEAAGVDVGSLDAGSDGSSNTGPSPQRPKPATAPKTQPTATADTTAPAPTSSAGLTAKEHLDIRI